MTERQEEFRETAPQTCAEFKEAFDYPGIIIVRYLC